MAPQPVRGRAADPGAARHRADRRRGRAAAARGRRAARARRAPARGARRDDGRVRARLHPGRRALGRGPGDRGRARRAAVVARARPAGGLRHRDRAGRARAPAARRRRGRRHGPRAGHLRGAGRARRRRLRAAAVRRPEDSRRRRVLRALSTVLIVAGGLIVVDAVLTVTWQEPLTAFTTGRAQADLEGQLRDLRDDGATAREVTELRSLAAEPVRIAYLARSLRQRAREGRAVARLRIPAIGVDKVVVQGTDAASLRRGPGIYDRSPFPGVPGTTAIAGHRTTYGAPFRHVDQLDRGDRMIVEMPYGTFTYRVQRTRIVTPQDVSVLESTGTDRLVLTACHPLFSADERIVVIGRLVSAIGRGAGKGEPLRGPQLTDRVQRPATDLKLDAGAGR
ncbi:sortase [Conexibacter sp. W3-3-2]|nr:sortase [Conexibacter sp. W3-3-2]